MIRFFTTALVFLSLSLTVCAPRTDAAVSSVSPLLLARLRCASLTNPLGIDDMHPSLSWISRSRTPEVRDQSQSAYQVEAASSALQLVQNADQWNSGKVLSDQSVEVKYAGHPLRSNTQYFWRVRIWDQAGRPSAWSAPAFWTMGVLSPAEWKAKWIKAAEQELRLRDFTLETSFTIQHEAVTVYFRAHGPGDAYMWQINTAGSQPMFRPHLRVNGGYQVLKNIPLGYGYTNTDFQQPHVLRITASGSTITTYIDGHLIDTTVDKTLSEGTIGFRDSSSETTTFRSLKVTDPAGKIQFKDDFAAKLPSLFSAGKLGPNGLTVSSTDSMLGTGGLRTPMLRHEFTLVKPVRRAWLYASALGIYAASLNGKRVGDRFYAPGWTNYYRRVQYQCYDVTGQLRPGGNALGAQLAPGWYCGKVAWLGPNNYGGDSPAFFAELHIQYADGTVQIVASDGSWKYASGPVVRADNLDGESYDARLERPGWDRAGLHDASWRPAAVIVLPKRIQMVAQMDPPIRATQTVPAESVTQPQPGIYIYKLPQDITGVARVRVQGRAGTTITIRQGEVLNPDGTLNLITLESPGIAGVHADAIDHYTFGAPGVAVFQPEFTFHGFQYIEVSGAASKPALSDVVGVVYGTDVPHIGSFHTSSAFLNQLQSDLQWSGRDAYMSVPMDCPQRSERLGWTGDANFYVPTAAFNFDMAAFYGKWERDMLADGQFSNVAPAWYSGDSGGTGGGWGDVGVNMPFVLWQSYGDTDIARTAYVGMGKWIGFLQSQSPGLITNGSVSAPADWKNGGEGTSGDLIATAYFAYDTKQLAEMAAALGHAEDARKYEALFGDIKKAFIAKFVQVDGTVGSGSQTSYVMALHIGLVPEGLIKLAGDKLVANVTRHQNHLTTGFVGTQWLLPTLTQIGRLDLAYSVLEQTTQPSWGYMMSHKTTTIWETWDVIAPDGSFPNGPYSLNHCALGSCGEWLYRTIGGIAPDPNYPGYKRFIVQPRPGGTDLHSASASYESVYGTIKTHWQLNGVRLVLDVDVPVNTKALIYVPTTSRQGVPSLGTDREAKTLLVGSGHYHFTSLWQPPMTVH